MKKLLFACFLLASSSVLAEWVNVGKSVDTNIYVDPSTIRKDGDLRQIWGIQDMKERDKDGEISRRYREEYDCKGERKRFLSATAHSEPMAGGKTLYTINEPSSWSDIRPNTVTDDILKMVCAN